MIELKLKFLFFAVYCKISCDKNIVVIYYNSEQNAIVRDTGINASKSDRLTELVFQMTTLIVVTFISTAVVEIYSIHVGRDSVYRLRVVAVIVKPRAPNPIDSRPCTGYFLYSLNRLVHSSVAAVR